MNQGKVLRFRQTGKTHLLLTREDQTLFGWNVWARTFAFFSSVTLVSLAHKRTEEKHKMADQGDSKPETKASNEVLTVKLVAQNDVRARHDKYFYRFLVVRATGS